MKWRALIAMAQLTLKLRSIVCRSVMRTDLAEPSVLLDSCVLGRTAYKDFTVWNRSEIDLEWALMATEVVANAPPGSSALDFTDMDSGELLPESGTVSGYAIATPSCSRTGGRYVRGEPRMSNHSDRRSCDPRWALPRFGHVRIRLNFKAQAVGDYHYLVHLLNRNDEHNTVLIQ